MADDRLVGKQQYLTLGGTTIQTKKITPTVERKLADNTDTSNYDGTDDVIYSSQLPVSVKVSFDVEGWYYKSATPSTVVTKMFGGGGPWTVTFGPGTGYPHFGGKYDLSNFKIESQFDDVVNVSFKLESNGKITPNS